MIKMGLLSIVILVAVFVAGFLVSKIWGRRSIHEMKEEMETLRMRLLGAEHLLSEKAMQSWQGINTLDTASGRQAADVRGGMDRLDLDKTGISSGKRKRSKGSGAMVQPERGQKVRLTKVIGPEDGIKLQFPLLGLEEAAPVVGESYRMLKEDGGTFCTSVVTKISPGYIQTLNSVYKIERLEYDEAPGSDKEG
jgi:hypothetical protein